MANTDVWAVVSAVAGTIAAIAALVTVWQAKQTVQESREGQRPYFLVEGPGVKSLPGSPRFRIEFPLKNVGGRPASSLEGRIYMAPRGTPAQPTMDNRLSVANDIPPNSPTPWYNDSADIPPNVPQHDVLMAISYKDPVLDKRHTQVFFMRWEGVRDGVGEPNFVHVSATERERIEREYAEVLEPYRSGG